jgi:hypothetical protein
MSWQGCPQDHGCEGRTHGALCHDLIMVNADDYQGASSEAIREGVTPDALPAIRRELFMDALMVARTDHDPGMQWEQFCEAAWREAALAFGFVAREPWPEGLPRPALADERQSGQRDSDDLS